MESLSISFPLNPAVTHLQNFLPAMETQAGGSLPHSTFFFFLINVNVTQNAILPFLLPLLIILLSYLIIIHPSSPAMLHNTCSFGPFPKSLCSTILFLLQGCYPGEDLKRKHFLKETGSHHCDFTLHPIKNGWNCEKDKCLVLQHS
jgi:hypothetical protein